MNAPKPLFSPYKGLHDDLDRKKEEVKIEEEESEDAEFELESE
jgi:hypothetical protein